MITKTQIEIITAVKTVIDELGVNDADFLGESSQDSLDEVIKSKILESVEQIYKTASWHLLDGMPITEPKFEINTNLSATLQLPKDFLRLVAVQISDWKFTVNTYAMEDSPIHRRQLNIHSRGTADKPICVLCKNNDGDYLELFSAVSNEATLIKSLYVAKPEFSEIKYQLRLSICEKLETSIYYRIAGLTLMTFGDTRANELITLSTVYNQL